MEDCSASAAASSSDACAAGAASPAASASRSDDPTPRNQSKQRRSRPGEAAVGSSMPRALSLRFEAGESSWVGSMKSASANPIISCAAETCAIEERLGTAKRVLGGRQPMARGAPGMLKRVASVGMSRLHLTSSRSSFWMTRSFDGASVGTAWGATVRRRTAFSSPPWPAQRLMRWTARVSHVPMSSCSSRITCCPMMRLALPSIMQPDEYLPRRPRGGGGSNKDKMGKRR
eukprot:407363-Prymnesium_polylepis.1